MFSVKGITMGIKEIIIKKNYITLLNHGNILWVFLIRERKKILFKQHFIKKWKKI